MKGKGLVNVKDDVKHWVLKHTKSGSDGKLSEHGDKATGNGMPSSSIAGESGSADGTRTSIEVPPKVTFSAKGTEFRVDPRYGFVKTLGLGAYGVVCAATDAKLGKGVAIKKVAGVFDDQTDAKRIIREIRLLSSMKHDNILEITDIDEPESYATFNDVYIMTELMDTDLNKLLRSKHPLLDAQRKFFTYQMFRALKYIHSASILHRDLKPANVLVSENVRTLRSSISLFQ
jgi:serine/threonine protein kinase